MVGKENRTTKDKHDAQSCCSERKIKGQKYVQNVRNVELHRRCHQIYYLGQFLFFKMALEVKVPIYSVRCFDGELLSVKRNATIVWVYLFLFRVKYLFIFRAFFFQLSACKRQSERERGEYKRQREGKREIWGEVGRWGWGRIAGLELSFVASAIEAPPTPHLKLNKKKSRQMWRRVLPNQSGWGVDCINRIEGQTVDVQKIRKKIRQLRQISLFKEL